MKASTDTRKGAPTRRRAARRAAAAAAKAETPAAKLAALITLEAVDPQDNLADPELILAAADGVEGGSLAAEMDKAAETARSEAEPDDASR